MELNIIFRWVLVKRPGVPGAMMVGPPGKINLIKVDHQVPLLPKVNLELTLIKFSASLI